MKPHLHILHGYLGPQDIKTYIESKHTFELFHVTRGPQIDDNADIVYCQTYGQRNSFEQLLEWTGPQVIHVGGDIWDERGNKKGSDTLRDIEIVFRRASKIVCVGKYLSKVIKGHVPDADVTYLKGGMWGLHHTRKAPDPKNFVPKYDYEIYERPKVVSAISLSVERKWRGIPIFLDACEDFIKIHNCDVRCFGKARGQFDKIALWRKRGFVHYGYSKNWWKILNSADIYIHPSMFDGFPRTISEAMCVGLPILTFDSAGCGEVGKSMMICDPNNPSDIMEKFDVLLGSRGLREKLGVGARKEAVRKTKKHEKDYPNLIMEVLR